MGLLVDGELLTLAELRVYDSSILEVANTEMVDLTAKLDLVHRQAVEDMSRALRRKAGSGFPVEQVVATESVRRWWAYRALEMIYRDVYFSQLNDRYGERWHTYERLATESERSLWHGGLGRNYMPLVKPSSPAVAIVTGTMMPGTYFVATTWVSSRGEESSPSTPCPVDCGAMHGISVETGVAPAAATGWRVYAGPDVDSLALQTASPLSIGSSWQKTAGGWAAGPRPGTGQQPDEYYIPGGHLRRG